MIASLDVDALNMVGIAMHLPCTLDSCKHTYYSVFLKSATCNATVNKQSALINSYAFFSIIKLSVCLV